MEDWAEIRRLHRAEGVSISEISRRLGIARNTVRRALTSDRPPRYERAPRPRLTEAVEPAVRALPTCDQVFSLSVEHAKDRYLATGVAQRELLDVYRPTPLMRERWN